MNCLSSLDLDMPKTYAHEPTDIVVSELDDETLLSIGRLIRAFAEIEDLVFLYLCGLAETSETKATILFASVPLQKKLEMAEYLAQTTGEQIVEMHRTLFDATFKEALQLRNTVAHGVFLGKDPKEHRLLFLTNKTSPPVGTAARVAVEGWLADNIKQYSVAATTFIKELEAQLRLQPLRERRLLTTLQAHPKGRKPQSKKRRPDARPRSSQE